MTTKTLYIGLDEYLTRGPLLADLFEKVLTIDNSGSVPKIVFKLGTSIIDVVGALEAALKDGVATDGDTLAKLRGLISSLNSSLTSEAARLDARIDNVISNLDPAAIDSLSELLAALNAGDGNLATAIAALGTSTNSAITAEATRAQAAEAQIASDLAAEISRAQSAEGTLQSNINSEAGSRATADTQLQANIDALDTYTVVQIDLVNTAINNEIAGRNSAVNAEITARQAAVAAEQARAIAAEAQLAADLANAIAANTFTAQDGIEITSNVSGGKDIKVKVSDIIDGDLLVLNGNGDITLADYIQPRVI